MKFIFSPYNFPAFNIAAEEYLFDKNVDDIIFLYINAPSVIIGSNQVVANEVNIDFCKRNQIDIIRRLSGGGAVYHDAGNLNFCFISSNDKVAPLSNGFLLPVKKILDQMEIKTIIGKRKDLWLPGNFKITGTASHVRRNRVLHHGTLLYDTETEVLNIALNPKDIDQSKKGTVSVRSSVKNIREFLIEAGKAAPEKELFFQMFTNYLREIYDNFESCFFTDSDLKSIKKLQTEKYQSPDWTFRK